MEPCVSIIVPVYQVEKYVIECLESIRRQTFTDYEVIIVNDGSKDRSEELVIEYINKFKLTNFQLYTKTNGGLSSARNAGMKKAKGEWLLFVDSDDWLEVTALKSLVACADKYPADVVYGGIRAVDNETREKEDWSDYTKEYGEVPKDIAGYNSFEFCWGRLYRRSIVENNHLQFDERIKYAEDNAWQFDYVQYAKHYSCTNDIVYNYRTNRVGALTYTPAKPQAKRFIWEHMCGFVDVFGEDGIIMGIKENVSLSRVMWTVLSTAVINDILDGEDNKAKEKRRTVLAKVIRSTYRARTRKDKIYLAMWDGPFVLMKVLVLVYYRNFDMLRKTRILNMLSEGIKM